MDQRIDNLTVGATALPFDDYVLLQRRAPHPDLLLMSFAAFGERAPDDALERLRLLSRDNGGTVFAGLNLPGAADLRRCVAVAHRGRLVGVVEATGGQGNLKVFRLADTTVGLAVEGDVFLPAVYAALGGRCAAVAALAAGMTRAECAEAAALAARHGLPLLCPDA